MLVKSIYFMGYFWVVMNINRKILLNLFSSPIKNILFSLSLFLAFSTACYADGAVVTKYRYDALGRKIFVSNPGADIGTSYQYDYLGRIVREEKSDGSVRTISYYANNATVKDERNNVTTYKYRSYGDPGYKVLMGIISPESRSDVAIERNSKDVINSVTQAGKTRTYKYNSYGYITEINNPETGVTVMERDMAGNLMSRKTGNGAPINYKYDGLNRLVLIKYASGISSIILTYSKTDKLISSNFSTGTHNYIYDDNGNMLSDFLSVDGINFMTSYSYDGNDQMKSITYPGSGRTINYLLDHFGRPVKVVDYLKDVTYWPSGQLKKVEYINGISVDYNQNSRMWPSNFSVRKDNLVHMNSHYSYDGIGNLTKVNDDVDTSYVRVLAYDAINRLTMANGPWGAGTIEYDGVGNIVLQNFGGANLNYQYDQNNRLRNVAGMKNESYSYDDNGSVSAISGKVNLYDEANNLRCFDCNNLQSKVEYAYDGKRQRVSVLKRGVKTFEFYDQKGNLLIEFSPLSKNKFTEYIYLGNKRVAQRVGN